MSLVLDATGLSKRFEETVAVDGVDLRLEPGQIHGLLGPNGAGKTTVLGMLLGLIHPDSGTVRLFGRTREEAGQRVLDGVGGFIENPRFYPYLSATRNLRLLAGLDSARSTGRVMPALVAAGLDPGNHGRVGGYSLGMRQRLGLAAALLREPRLLVLDEPANGLDPAGIRDLHAVIRKLAADGLTVLLSSHNMNEVEDLCDDVTIMRAGSVAFSGSIAQLQAQAPDPAFSLHTSDNARAVQLGGPDVLVKPGHDELVVHAQPERLDEFMIALGKANIAVRSLQLVTRPLEALFFSLTETAGSA